MAYAIVTLSRKSVVAAYVVPAPRWADALAALEEAMDDALGYGLKVDVKGTWQRPYARRGECPRTTSFSAYTKGYSAFTYIKKVEDGLTSEEVFEALAEEKRNSLTYEERMADLCGVARPRNAAEAEEFRHCHEMGDFDF